MSTMRYGLVAFGVLGLSLGACSRERPGGPRAARSARALAPAASLAASASANAALPPPTPGTIPFDFPVGTTSARVGEFVLAPSRAWLDEAFQKGAATQSFIFYGAWMQSPGPKESQLKTLPGQTSSIPNPLIIAVGPGAKANPGDVVLTAWASGSGMQRAIVVEGGSPERPKVRYLDLEFESPSGWGQKDDELPEKTFRVLSTPGEPGTTVACKDGTRQVRWLVVSVSEDEILGLGFAGRMKVLSREACKPLPISPKVKKGERVWVPVVGTFAEAKVTNVEEAIGRVFVLHSFGGTEKEEAVSFTNVATTL